jgi:hypothetical protein
VWRLKPPHNVNINVKTIHPAAFDFDVDFVWRLCATRYEAVGFV